jgi:hypothetical protein
MRQCCLLCDLENELFLWYAKDLGRMCEGVTALGISDICSGYYME